MPYIIAKSMKFHILSYDRTYDVYYCRDQDGILHRVDFTIAREIKDIIENRESIVGKTIHAGEVQAVVLVASRLTIEEERGSE